MCVTNQITMNTIAYLENYINFLKKQIDSRDKMIDELIRVAEEYNKMIKDLMNKQP